VLPRGGTFGQESALPRVQSLHPGYFELPTNALQAELLCSIHRSTIDQRLA
jgi:hypothetical protein